MIEKSYTMKLIHLGDESAHVSTHAQKKQKLTLIETEEIMHQGTSVVLSCLEDDGFPYCHLFRSDPVG